jgi:PKD repeat protein
MNLSVNSLTVGNSGCGQGLPNYVTGYTKPSNPQISSSLNCQQVTFNAPSYTSSAGCSTLPFPITGYLWDFGDVSSGALNTATVASTSHFYSSLGTYTVSLIVYTNCENDTIKKVITVSALSPSITVAGNFSICKGDKRIYTASGGTAYAWSNSTNAASATLSPVTTTTYNVIGTSSLGCTVSKLFTVTVNPCLNISTASAIEIGAHIFPNPFNSTLNVEVSQATEVQVYNLQGKIVLETHLESGTHDINTNELQSGVYLMRLSNKAGVWQTRVVKME